MAALTFIGLYTRHRDWMTGGEYREPVTSERCWKCGTERPDLAHAVYEYVAAVLGEELYRRVMAAEQEHVATYGCGWSCPDVQELWDLLPDYMRPVAIA